MYLIDESGVEIYTLTAWVNRGGEVILGEHGNESRGFFTMTPLEARKLAANLKAAAHEAQS